ncbi:MAG: ribosome-binding factor A, partial [Chitinophagales bacterium]
MESRRQQKMESLLKRAMSEILMKQGGSFYPNKTLVSITSAKVSPDLSIARFYLSVFNGEDNAMLIDILNHHVHEFRRALGNKLRNHLRKIPEISFFLDDTIEHMHK